MNKTLVTLLAAIIVVGLGWVAWSYMYPAAPAPALQASDFTWQFTEKGENTAIGAPQTQVTLVTAAKTYDVGTYNGSCTEIGTTGGIDGKGLLAGELAAVQCWFAGGGDEVGVFAHEDGGFDVMVGELGEGEEGAGMFRGNFNVLLTVPAQ